MDRILHIRRTWPSKVPCVVSYGNSKIKLIMPREHTIGHLMLHTRSQLIKRILFARSKDKGFFMFHNDKLMSGTTVIGDLDTMKSGVIGFTCQEESVFG